MTNWLPNVVRDSGPLYRAIADALAEDVANGRLSVGSRLPTHRDLAYRLNVTVGTVTRAYAEAERRGLIGGEVGRGTFVLGRHKSAEATAPGWLLPPEPTAGESALVDMTLCEPRALGVEREVASTMAEIAADGLMEQLLTYAPLARLPAYRTAGAAWLARCGIEVSSDSVMVTIGAQNAIAIALGTVARPGDVVLTESLTYLGVRAICTTFGLHLEGVAMDEDGLLPDAFESACRRLSPRALYTVPTLHNPTTATQPLARRVAIAEIARRYGTTIIEDDVFGFLAPKLPSIYSLAPDITLFTLSLSKSIAAGLRVGYLVAPSALMPRLANTLRALNYAPPALLTELVTRWINDGRAERFANTQREEAAARQALAHERLPACLIARQRYGHHQWLTLPEPWRREDFIAEARQRGVAIVGADAFTVGRASAPHAVRIGLCMPSSREDVDRGLAILGSMLAAPMGGGRAII